VQEMRDWTSCANETLAATDVPPSPQARVGPRPSGTWKDDDYDVLADAVVVGRIFLSAKSPVGTPWMWTLLFGHQRTAPRRTTTTRREAAMAAFAKSWRRE
jgi:hypothetical protein